MGPARCLKACLKATLLGEGVNYGPETPEVCKYPPSLLSRKELGWSKLRLRPRPAPYPASHSGGQTLSGIKGHRKCLGAQVLSGHTGLSCHSSNTPDCSPLQALASIVSRPHIIGSIVPFTAHSSVTSSYRPPLTTYCTFPPDPHTVQLLISAGLRFFAQMSSSRSLS